MKPPLDGVKVLDFSELLPGPFMTQTLAEMGADVLKIERPPHGDAVRSLSPGVFAAVNRGKRSRLVDLKSEAGRAEVRALVAEADVLVESYRPGTLARHGLDYASAAALQPRLVYVSLSGYGQDGPDAQLPGHDINYLAASGALALGGDGDTPPSRLPLPFADLGGAMLALSAVLAALYQRSQTGRGQHLDVALSESMLHWMGPRLGAFHEAGHSALAQQRGALVRPAYGSFVCSDGAWITVAALETPFFRSLVRALALDAYAGEQWHAPARRAAEARAINAALAQALQRLPAEEALARLREADVPAMRVLAPAELGAHPQHLARGALVPTEAAGLQPRYPVRLEGMAPPPTQACALDGDRRPA